MSVNTANQAQLSGMTMLKKAPSLPPVHGHVLQRKCDCGTHTIGGGPCEGCSKQKPQTLERRPARMVEQTSGTEEVPSIVHDVLRSSGQPLDAGVRSFMEPRFGHDFSRVRVHTDSKAAESAQAVNAVAYTVGPHIAFGIGAYAPGSVAGRHLLAHELTHVVRQREGGGAAIQGKLRVGESDSVYEREADAVADAVAGGGAAFAPLRPTGGVPLPGLIQRREAGAAKPAAEAAPDFTKPGWKRVSKLGIVRVDKPGTELSGARLRKGASTSADQIHHLEENTRISILAENKTTVWPQWLYVVVLNKKYAGSVGYIADHLVWTSLPDPDAELYYIAEPSLGLQKLVENHPKYKDYDIRTGDDARSIVMAVVVANEEDPRTTKGVRLNPEKLEAASKPGTWEGLKDKADEYRSVLRPILQSVELFLDEKIWLPGKSYIEALKGKGIIPTRAGWKNAAIAVGKGIGGFGAGLGEGFLMSIADVFIGIYDLIKSIISLITSLVSGEALKSAQEFYDTVKDMSASELFTMLKDALVQMITSSANDFANKWNSNNTYDRWNFRGYVIGYILAEIVMIIFTAGTATIAKWLGKLGKIGAKILKVLMKVFDKVDDVLDKVPGRKGRKKDAGGADKKDPKKDKGDDADKARELPAALILASSIAETHDAQNSPASVAQLSLNALKRRYKWIKGFGRKKISPGHYKILMYASEHVIDEDYTTGHDEEDDVAAQVKAEFEEAQQKVPTSDLPEAKGKITKAQTSWIKLVHDNGVIKGKAGAVRDGLTPNIPGKGKAWDNPYEFDGPFGKGIDDIMFDKNGDPVILEYKGANSELNGDQMARSWVCRKIAQLAKRNDPMAKTLADAMKNGKLTGRLYRTPVSHSGKAGDPLQVGEAVLERSWNTQYKGKC